MPWAFRQGDSYPEEKTHNHAKYTYAPYLVVPRPANIVKCGGCNACNLTFVPYCSGGCVSRRTKSVSRESIFDIAAAFVELSTDKIDLFEDPFSSA